jgi:hypothetical protein
MAFTESFRLQKGHFLSSNRGRSFKKYFFHSLNAGALYPRKRALFLLLEKVGGTCPHCPPGSAAPVIGSEFFIKTRIRIRQFWIGMDFNNISQLSDYKRPIRSDAYAPLIHAFLSLCMWLYSK